jgi:hypothetical protein
MVGGGNSGSQVTRYERRADAAADAGMLLECADGSTWRGPLVPPPANGKIRGVLLDGYVYRVGEEGYVF